ncbi:unnamed protein product [Macrosiphum euphorbiae]|uniref:Uncharacterized protein n=1 Tax=Macrosiphum euphorbiae TaxID=13131 RepID=A0AAV0VWZ1_9HEMI|nr:unnamed protein product [Macrosiphum euphorbiae]
MREVLGRLLGRLPKYEDVPLILSGLEFEGLLADPGENMRILRDAEDSFRLLYSMAENFLTAIRRPRRE